MTNVATCYTLKLAVDEHHGILSMGAATYNGLNVKFQATDIHRTGLSIIANYTYSHTLIT